MSNYNLLGLYDTASTWTLSKVSASLDKMNNETPCDSWSVRSLINHMLDTQRYFTDAARGQDASPPSATPPDAFDDNPIAVMEQSRRDLMQAFSADGVIEKTGPSLVVALSDQLLHGWDLAKATGQDASMPDGVAAIAYETIHGLFTDDQREGIFKPEVPVPASASAQDRYLAFTGRNPF